VVLEAQEALGRRDVVIDDDQPVGRAQDQRPRGAADGEMEQADRVGRRDRRVALEAERQVRDARVRRLGEDLGLEPGPAQQALQGERVVSDRVAVPSPYESAASS
jgi:hypothetical protein